MSNDIVEFKEEGDLSNLGRTTLQLLGGAIPFAGGLFSAFASSWSEFEQKRMNEFLQHWLKMLQDEIKEKEKTLFEIIARVNIHDEAIIGKMESIEYQSLMRKTFREWAGAESEVKRTYIRNILSNTATSDIASFDVVRLFIDWLKKYSELHFLVIRAIYNSSGISRGAIWEKIGKGPVREDSADADLYKLLIRDLSTGGIIRQHRETTHDGRFLKSAPAKKSVYSKGSKEMTSAFDTNEEYELTGLGEQFVHYAMTEVTTKIEEKASQ
jgi:hypothetical protein